MSIRKLLPLAGLVLAIAALAPASALAKTWTLKGTTAGVTSIDEAGNFESHVTGRSSHGGKYTRLAWGSAATGEGEFHATFLANNNQLWGFFSSTKEETSPGTFVQEVDITVQGGTGQFAGMCGTGEETDYLSVFSVGPPTLLSREGTFTVGIHDC
jgi:hypothetical protein